MSCDKSFYNNQSYRKHLFTKHNIDMEANPVGRPKKHTPAETAALRHQRYLSQAADINEKKFWKRRYDATMRELKRLKQLKSIKDEFVELVKKVDSYCDEIAEVMAKSLARRNWPLQTKDAWRFMTHVAIAAGCYTSLTDHYFFNLPSDETKEGMRQYSQLESEQVDKLEHLVDKKLFKQRPLAYAMLSPKFRAFALSECDDLTSIIHHSDEDPFFKSADRSIDCGDDERDHAAVV